MSGQREMDISNFQHFKELRKLKPKMTGQNGHPAIPSASQDFAKPKLNVLKLREEMASLKPEISC